MDVLIVVKHNVVKVVDWSRPEEQMLAAIPFPAWVVDAETGEFLGRNVAAERFGSAPAQAGSTASAMNYRGRAARLIVDASSHEGQLRELIDGSADIIYETDAAGRFTFVNAAVKRVLGYASSDVLGKHFTTLISPEWQAAAVDHYRKQVDARAATTYFEFPCIDREGATVWVGQRVQPIVRDGAIAGFRAIARDVTDRRIAEESKREFEERFQSFMNHSPVVAFLKEPSGRFVYVNNEMERVFGHPGESLIGCFDTDVFTSGISEQIGNSDDEVIRTGATIKLVESIQANDGSVHQFLFYKFPVRSGGHTLVGAAAIDLTDRIELEQQVAEARDAALASAKLKSEFLATMSHEIRTPMNGVMGMLGILSDTTINADQRDLIDTARSSAESLLTIINDILDFSKIEAGRMSMESEAFDLQPAVDGVIELVADSARKKGLDLGCVIDSNVPRSLRGDAGRLRQVLLNLVGNALKFTEKGGVVMRVSLERETEDHAELLFRVIDTGIGIAGSVQHLFDAFVQADATTTRRFGGTGLGLAISKKLVEMMNGVIDCESEPGAGSTFWFTARFSKVASLAKTESEIVRTTPNVLVVDDSATSRQILSLQLASWGVPHAEAADGLEAFSKVRNAAAAGQPFNIVLSDLRMPQLDGLGLARLIQADQQLASAQFILMTGSTDAPGSESMKAAGISRSLQKPLKHRQLFCALFGEEPESRPSVPVPAAPAAQAVIDRSMRILIVEDNAVNQKVAMRQLQKLGYAADAVANGLEAVEAVGRIAYDLVFMDCHMPEMDGFEATREIRRRETGCRRTPIVALTASAQASDRDLCLEAGMDDFVTKPVREQALVAAISKWSTAKGQLT